MNVTGQCGHERDILYVLLSVEHGLIQMRRRPPLGNVVLKQLGQFPGGLSRNVVSPGAERHQQLSLAVKGHVTVHHAADSQSAQPGEDDSVLFLYIANQIPEAVLKARPDILQGIRPDPVFQPVLPIVTAGSDGIVLFVVEHRFDSGGAQLNPQNRIARGNLLCIIRFHFCHVKTLHN